MISFKISCFWDGGFDLALGIEPNFVVTGHAETHVDACRWLRIAALKHYPHSAFSKKHGHGLRLVPAKDDEGNLKA